MGQLSLDENQEVREVFYKRHTLLRDDVGTVPRTS